jgi:glycosyltransferase involved in cell wall biosynthesis
MAPRRQLVFANSVDYARHTGGWVYNTRVMQELGALGWEVLPLDLPAGFPRPDNQAQAQSAQLLAALPDRMLVVADQICLSPLVDTVARESDRLRLVMLFHHPIAQEQGLPIKQRLLFQLGEPQALAGCRLVVATSPSTARALVAEYRVDPDRIVVAVPGIERFAPSPVEGSDVPRMLSVGAVIERKGYHLLVAALAGLREAAWQLDIVGDLDRAPDYVAELRRRIGAAGLSGRIKLTGGIARSDLEYRWRGAHVYVAASLHEGYGMAVAEAIARGLPTVTTRAGAVGDWLDPEAAIIVPNGAPEALRTAIARVLADPALRSALRAGALKQASGFPSWADAARAIDERLTQL